MSGLRHWLGAAIGVAVIAGTAGGVAAQPRQTQVTVESRIANTSRNVLRQLGINWGGYFDIDVAAIVSPGRGDVGITHRSSAGNSAAGTAPLGGAAVGVEVMINALESQQLPAAADGGPLGLRNLPIVARAFQTRVRVEDHSGRSVVQLSGIDNNTQDPDARDALKRGTATTLAAGIELFLGQLFRRVERRNDEREVMVVLRPNIVEFAPPRPTPSLADVVGIAPLGPLAGPATRPSRAGQVTLAPWIGVRFEDVTLSTTFTEAGSTRTYRNTKSLTELSFGADLNVFVTDDVFLKLGWTRDHFPSMTVGGAGPINAHTATSRAMDIDRFLFGLGVRLN